MKGFPHSVESILLYSYSTYNPIPINKGLISLAFPNYRRVVLALLRDFTALFRTSSDGTFSVTSQLDGNGKSELMAEMARYRQPGHGIAPNFGETRLYRLRSIARKAKTAITQGVTGDFLTQ